MRTSTFPIIFAIVSLDNSCISATRFHSFLVPNDEKRWDCWSLTVFVILIQKHAFWYSKYSILIIPNFLNRRERVIKQSHIVEAASDKVWQTSSSLFHTLEKVETAAIHAAVDAVRDEVDTIFHDIDHHESTLKAANSSSSIRRKEKSSPKVKAVSVKQEQNTITKYPYDLSYGWGSPTDQTVSVKREGNSMTRYNYDFSYGWGLDWSTHPTFPHHFEFCSELENVNV